MLVSKLNIYMKNIIKIKLLLLGLFLVACKDQLDVVNPNDPTIVTLDSESGISRAALGVYGAVVIPSTQTFEGGLLSWNFIWMSLTNHELMGDAVYCPFGNFGWRWINQVGEITLDNGTKITPPQGGTQGFEVESRNTRALGDDNPSKHEWYSMYNVNNTCNLVILKLDEGSIPFTGNAEVKQKALRAFAHFWKGYTYSRIGSMYSAGIITDVWGSTNANFVDNNAMIVEANKQLDAAITILTGLTNTADYQAILENVIPDLGRNKVSVPTPTEWIRNINTLKARNLLVNKKRKDMTNADWQAILTLANQGLQAGDFNFVAKQDDETVTTALVPHRVLIGWAFPSERMIQDFKANDARFTKYFTQLATSRVNERGRGIQYGTRWAFKPDTDLASTTAGQATVYLGGTSEENELMKAEAKIALNDIDGGLTHIDAVRTAQGANLTAVSGTGLTQAQALEELRRERRIGLLLRGVAFYDARRWGVIDPVSAGGGRTGAIVLSATGAVNTNATMDYRYLNYFGPPANELDFNAPSAGSADIRPK
jgi:starch-binding outer membrane protein, SusD/RagB family